MCDSDTILEYGLVGAFDTVANMMGEDTAIILQNAEAVFNPSDDSDGVPEGDVEVTYMELKYNSEALSLLLYYRFGVRVGDTILILCNDNASAEIVACLACCRLGAPFVPLDISWLEHDPAVSIECQATSMIATSRPKCAIVVRETSQDDMLDDDSWNYRSN